MKSILIKYPVQKKLIFTFVLVVISIFLAYSHYSNINTDSWGWDDTAILKIITLYTPFQYFFDPSIWQQYNAANLTPWLLLSHHFDLSLFSLNAKYFYFHQYVSITLAIVILYYVLTIWLKKQYAFLISIFILFSVPISTIYYQLMTRHYIEGLVFSLISIALFHRSITKKTHYCLLFSSFFYLLAVTAKEVYVPLPGFLIFLQAGNFKDRVIKLLPFGLIGLIYIYWRYKMLGVLLGGYGLNQNSSIVFFILRFISNLLGYAWYSYVLFAALMLPAIFIIFDNFKKRIPGLVILFIIITPLYPIAYFLESGRHMLLPIIISLFIIFYSWQNYIHKYPKIKFIFYALISGFLFNFLIPFNAIVDKISRQHNSYSSKWNFIYNTANNNDIMYVQSGDSWFEDNSKWLAQKYKNKDVNLFFDFVELDKNMLNKFNFFEYDFNCQCVNQAKNFEHRFKEWNKRVTDSPLSIEIKYTKNLISWKFGPDVTGNYFFIVPGKLIYAVPYEGIYRSNISYYSSLIVKHISDSGDIKYSPEFTIEHENMHISWNN